MDPDALAAACAHACARWPEEACGVIVRWRDGGRAFVAVPNVAADPRRGFELDPAAQLRLWTEAAAGRLALEAIVHSHPDGNPEFSEEDRASATHEGRPLHPGLAWWILGIAGPPPRLVAAAVWRHFRGGWVGERLAVSDAVGGGLLRLLGKRV